MMGFIRIKDKIEYPAYAIWFDPEQEPKYNNEFEIHLLEGRFNCFQQLENNSDIRLWDCNGIEHGLVQIINQKACAQNRFEYTILKEIDINEYTRQKLYLGTSATESHRQSYANTFSSINSLLAISHLEQYMPIERRQQNMKKFKCYGSKVEIWIAPHADPIVIAILPFMRPIILERLRRDLIINQELD